MAAATTAIAALQPVAMRFGATATDPLIFSTLAVVSAAICAALVLGVRNKLPQLIARRYAPRLFLLSLSGTLATTLLLIYGLQKIDAVAGVILLESEPIYSLILASAFLDERPSRRQLLATATILAGIGSVFGAGRAFMPLYAAALVFLTPLFWQISHVISLRVMPPLEPLTVTGARYIYTAVVLLPCALLIDYAVLPRLTFEIVLSGCLTGVIVYFLGSLTWYGAISRLSLAWTTALVIPGVPILSFAFAILLLGEHPSIRELAGIAIAIVGVAGLVTAKGARRTVAIEAAHQPIS